MMTTKFLVDCPAQTARRLCILLFGLSMAVAGAACSDPQDDGQSGGPIEDEDISEPADTEQDEDVRPDDDIHEEPAPVRDGVVESEWGAFWIKYAPSKSSYPFNEYFDLSVEIFTDEELEQPAADVTLDFDARVETLGGHLPTKVVVDALGEGKFEVRGLLFHVPRRWELRFKVSDSANDLNETARALVDPTEDFEPGEDPTGFFDADQVRRILHMSPEGGPPLPDVPSNAYADDPAAAQLGQFLFFDTRMSINGEVSCASCHAPDKGFADGRRLARGVGQTGRHAPTLLNAAFNRWQFWDGRADSMWSQALGPMEADEEHGTNRMVVARLMSEDATLREAYEAVFGELGDFSDDARFPLDARPIPDAPERAEQLAWESMSEQDREAISRVFANVGKALEAYERKLVSLDSDFDRFAQALREQDTDGMDILSEDAKRGLKFYLSEAGCDLCHNGPMLSNFEFHNLGIGTREWLSNDDDGRTSGAADVKESEFNAQGIFSDAPEADYPHLDYLPQQEFVQEGAFKTSTLRNITRTAPYMHGGEFETLVEVIKFYGDLQEDPPVGRRDALVQPFGLTAQKTLDLEAFMAALEGAELPESLTTQPDSPAAQP